jgi:hypothetical protein
MNPIKPISDELTRYRSHFATADYTAARRWLEAGCDLHRDILPVIRAKIATKRDIHSLGFFTADILKAKQARENAEQARARAATPEGEAVKARNIAFLVRIGKASPEHRAWLEAYQRRQQEAA